MATVGTAHFLKMTFYEFNSVCLSKFREFINEPLPSSGNAVVRQHPGVPDGSQPHARYKRGGKVQSIN